MYGNRLTERGLSDPTGIRRTPRRPRARGPELALLNHPPGDVDRPAPRGLAASRFGYGRDMNAALPVSATRQMW